MKLDTLLTYIEQCANDGLTKMTIEIDSTGDYDGVFYVTKTKETYSYDSESKSDAKVDEVKDNPGFTGVDKKFYTREWGEDEILPWDFIDIFIDKKFLLSERKKAYSSTVTGSCKSGCKGCGMQKVYGCKV